MSSHEAELWRALQRAQRELPTGSARARLTHYCGRLWDLLRSAEVIAGQWRPVAVSSDGPMDLGVPLVSCLAAIADLVREGVDSGEFVDVSATSVARLLVSSLFVRAQWCRCRVDPLLSGSCSRAVAETLEVILPALAARAAATVSDRPAIHPRTNPRSP